MMRASALFPPKPQGYKGWAKVWPFLKWKGRQWKVNYYLLFQGMTVEGFYYEVQPNGLAGPWVRITMVVAPIICSAPDRPRYHYYWDNKPLNETTSRQMSQICRNWCGVKVKPGCHFP